MVKQFEVRWEGELPARPQDVWDAITAHADGVDQEAEQQRWAGWLDGVFAAVGVA